MAQSSSNRGTSSNSNSNSRVVGDYIVGKQIGSGSFSFVWHGRHRVHGQEVAIKEIIMDRLSKKLQESLVSEIVILKNINHPNIIRLHDIIEVQGRIHLILEYCKGGDLSMHILRKGKVAEATAKHFMQQLAAGLQILRQNNVIHRDLKPQNLLLTTNDDQAVLKIADFGFARSLQPRGLAETLCGSPLYMAPEIMQFQKYDAKADLWSVGVILYQLVIGKTPFTGNNQIQLLQNIMKSKELQFPPDTKELSSDLTDLCRKLLRRDPVERLTFEEFFGHLFLSTHKCKEPSRTEPRTKVVNAVAECRLGRHPEASSQDDCLPFVLDDDTSGPDASPSNRSLIGSMRFGDARHSHETVVSNIEHHMASYGNIREPTTTADQIPSGASSRVMDSLENIDLEYVLVPVHSMEDSSLSSNASRVHHLPCKSDSSSTVSLCKNSVPVPISGTGTKNTYEAGSMESHNSLPSGSSQGSMDVGDALDQSYARCMTRIRSLQQSASAITELVNQKIDSGSQLEAFSLQLVNLAIWKQAMHICHTLAASAIDGSPTQETTRFRGGKSPNFVGTQGPEAVCSQIEKEFLLEVGHAEELATGIVPVDGNVEMPDAMEIIFQSALASGRHGAVDELMGEMDSAVGRYSKAVHLLVFLLAEAPSLILNPPFSLTNSDRFRLQSYIEILKNRQNQSRSQRMSVCKSEDQQ
ncbi:serine/threonine-protein kinase ATG1c-like isoform X1 [Papaver somniferum]|uniref:serine/threonine-protein kinase ATG1c-like isoform X1 n=1 Tax=Papaver somniferum TaxID=3469 RepID=UPI000E701922|nr:serine/threonine-protein kinase ATG1c-like isoform X1 [Papaver somniferum]